MRIVVIIFLLLSFVAVNAQKKDDKIVWSKEQKLTWEDFKGKPKSSSPFEAITNSGILPNYEYKNGVIKFAIISRFNPKKSWVKSKDRLILLDHEQLHFDITELYVRKFKKRLSETKFKSNPDKIKKQFYVIYDEIAEEKKSYQGLYDEETDFSRDEEKQKEWLKKIAQELSELEEYANPELIVDLNKKKKKCGK
jgi:hypothetical protein